MILFIYLWWWKSYNKNIKDTWRELFEQWCSKSLHKYFPFSIYLQALSLSKKYRKLSTMMELSTWWYDMMLGSNFGSRTMQNFFLFLALYEFVFIEFLDTPSLLWFINVVVCLINEMRATIFFPLRIIGAQDFNGYPIMSRCGVLLKQVHVLRCWMGFFCDSRKYRRKICEVVNFQ